MNDDRRTGAKPSPGAQPPQRSSRAPAEGADPRSDPGFDRSPADAQGRPMERSARDPAEGKPDPAENKSQWPGKE